MHPLDRHLGVARVGPDYVRRLRNRPPSSQFWSAVGDRRRALCLLTTLSARFSPLSDAGYSLSAASLALVLRPGHITGSSFVSATDRSHAVACCSDSQQQKPRNSCLRPLSYCGHNAVPESYFGHRACIRLRRQIVRLNHTLRPLRHETVPVKLRPPCHDAAAMIRCHSGCPCRRGITMQMRPVPHAHSLSHTQAVQLQIDYLHDADSDYLSATNEPLTFESTSRLGRSHMIESLKTMTARRLLVVDHSIASNFACE